MVQMKYLILVFELLLPTIILSQNKKLAPGNFNVDSIEYSKLCLETGGLQYYSVNAKHPKSSYQILHQARQVYKKPENCTQSGFLTVRFIVNCRGEAVAFHVYEIDENYQDRPFDTIISTQLLDFVKKLGDWKIGAYKDKTYNYYAYLCFKIKNGNLETVAP
jgi:hypothetical protein